jgi:hypothetical protein
VSQGPWPAGPCARLSRPHNQPKPNSPPPINPHQAHAGIIVPPTCPVTAGPLSHIDVRVRNEQVLPIDLQHHTPILVQGDQTSPLGLCLSPSNGHAAYVLSLAPPSLPYPSAHIWLTMLAMGFPIPGILIPQCFVADNQYVFRILLLHRFGEGKAPRNDGLAIDDDDLVM